MAICQRRSSRTRHLRRYCVIRDGGKLDLQGFTLTGAVVLDGRQAQLKHGKIQCALNGGSPRSPCVLLTGSGGHLIDDVMVRDNWINFEIQSNDNSIIGSTGFNSCDVSFLISGNNNTLTGNIAFGGTFGFLIEGDRNRITQSSSFDGATTHSNFRVTGNQNTITQNSAAGADESAFSISGDDNRISRNAVFIGFSGSSVGAFAVFGQNNSISDNLAPSLSAEDLNTNCGTNIWLGNVFAAVNQECIHRLLTSLGYAPCLVERGA
jgi:parallel beta-helix repeat protein